MIKKIAINQLATGMFIHDLDSAWLEHPFLCNRFKITAQSTVNKIKNIGVKHVYIDTKRGEDVDHAPTADEVKRLISHRMVHSVDGQTPHRRQTSAIEETVLARAIYQEAHSVVHDLMSDARLGKKVQL